VAENKNAEKPTRRKEDPPKDIKAKAKKGI